MPSPTKLEPKHSNEPSASGATQVAHKCKINYSRRQRKGSDIIVKKAVSAECPSSSVGKSTAKPEVCLISNIVIRCSQT